MKDQSDPILIRGVKAPDLLVKLMKENIWKQPPDEIWSGIVPWLKEKEDALILLDTFEEMRRESSGLDLFGDKWSISSKSDSPENRNHPLWLDIDNAFLIGVNKEIGSDLGLALDFRNNRSDPRVVASAYTKYHDISKEESLMLGEGQIHFWREVVPSFTEFCDTCRFFS